DAFLFPSTSSRRFVAKPIRRPSRSCAAFQHSVSRRTAPAAVGAPRSSRPPHARMSKQRAPDSRQAHRCGHVAIVGRPNVGKSTLVNALVGARISITSKKPQTTRHRVLGIRTTPAAQFVFVDTPGFQTEHRSRLNEHMNRTVRESLVGVDVIVLVVEALKLTEADRTMLALLPADRPVIACANKIDRIP